LVNARARKERVTQSEAVELARLKDEFARLTGNERKFGWVDEIAQDIVGVAAAGDPEDMLVFAGGKLIPAEYFDGDATQAAIDASNAQTPESMYEFHLSMGWPRVPEWEAELDMSQIEPELLDCMNPKWKGKEYLHTPVQFRPEYQNEKDE
jgi:hypothetical protein